MANEVTFVAGSFLRSASQYTPMGDAQVVDTPTITALPYRFGTLRIAGTLKTYGTPNQPTSRRVLLLERDSMRIVRGMYSNADGSYAFENLDAYPPKYMILGVDQLNEFNAVIADNIQAS